ncbi:hypothetical protein GQ600_27381 [Phytophthora cactorum]|nr:hypothetical protein GQ600_27381 [Phytophthora cactorum]
MNARLSHGSLEQRLKDVVSECASAEGNERLRSDCRIVLQTKAQRDIFGRWGDTLSLDWTHNCSNLGFYVGAQLYGFMLPTTKVINALCCLGTLKATVATVRGVSVLDYLCLSQQKESLLAVLQWFKKRTRRGGGLQSIVIDNDYTE